MFFFLLYFVDFGVLLWWWWWCVCVCVCVGDFCSLPLALHNFACFCIPCLGGVMLAASGGQPSLYRNCSFHDNYAFSGGAVVLRQSVGVFERCSFVNNRAASEGGTKRLPHLIRSFP